MASAKRTIDHDEIRQFVERTGGRATGIKRGNGRRVRDVMSPDPIIVTPGTRPSDAAQLMRDGDCGALPVAESLADPRPVGIITDRDIVIRGVVDQERLSELLVLDLMTAEPYSVREDDPLDVAVELLEERKIRRVIVVDDAGRICGMLSQADLVRAGERERAAEVIAKVSEPGEEPRPTV
jgi:CBS domain-containing protein